MGTNTSFTNSGKENSYFVIKVDLGGLLALTKFDIYELNENQFKSRL